MDLIKGTHQNLSIPVGTVLNLMPATGYSVGKATARDASNGGPWMAIGSPSVIGPFEVNVDVVVEAPIGAVYVDISPPASQGGGGTVVSLGPLLSNSIGSHHWNSLLNPRPNSFTTIGFYDYGDGGHAPWYYRPNYTGAANLHTRQDGDGNWWQMDVSQECRPESLGASGLGITDDEPYLTYACTVFWTCVLRDGATYAVASGVKIKQGHKIRGNAITTYTDLTLPNGHPAFPVIVALSTATSVIDLGYMRGANDSNGNPVGVYLYGARIEGIVIDATAPTAIDSDTGLPKMTCMGVSSGGNRIHLMQVQVVGGAVAFGGKQARVNEPTFTKASKATDCMFSSAGVGVLNFIDSEFVDTEIANNGVNVHGTTGADSNDFINCRIEWATSGCNIDLYQCSHYRFSNFIADAGNLAGVNLYQCHYIQFANTEHRRPSRTTETISNGSIGDCHFYIDGGSNLSFVGLTTATGHADNDPSNLTPTTPSYCFKFNSPADRVSIIGGDYTGCTVQPILNISAQASVPTNFIIQGAQGLDDFSNCSDKSRQTSNGRDFFTYAVSPTNVAPGGTFIVACQVPGLEQLFARGKPIRLNVWMRNVTHPSTKPTIATSFSLYVEREGASDATTIGHGVEYGPYGGAGSIGIGAGTSFNLAISGVAADGKTFLITGTNSQPTDGTGETYLPYLELAQA